MRDSSELQRDEDGLVKSLPWYIRLFAIFFKVINREVYVEEITNLNTKLDNVRVRNIGLKDKISDMVLDSEDFKETQSELLKQKDEKIISLSKEIKALTTLDEKTTSKAKPKHSYRKKAFRKKEIIDIFVRIEDTKEDILTVAKHYNVAVNKIEDIISGKLYSRFGVFHKYNKK